MSTKKVLPPEQHLELIKILQSRFEANIIRHTDIHWDKVLSRLETSPQKMWSLYAMENTGGEPDIIGFDTKTDEYTFYDCSPESPKGRRSLCYDPEALESRKEHKPKHSAIGMAREMDIELLTEEQYRQLQQFGNFDTKSSSWIATPKDIRAIGGAIFGDWRYGRVFIFHNGAESYYGARGFRGSLRL